MMDKIVADEELNGQLAEIIHSGVHRTTGEVIDFMARKQALRKDVSEEAPLDPNGIRWHCMVCGHTWTGWERVNPQYPVACAKCKSPLWNKIPSRKHDLEKGEIECAECAEIYKWLKREYDKIDQLLNSKIRSGDS